MADTNRARTTSTRRAAASTSARARAASAAGEPEERTAERTADPATHGERREGREAPTVCPVAFCPICTAVSAVNRATPDVVQHLLAAGQQFLLALQAIVDARAADYAEPDEEAGSRMQHIDIG